MRPEIFLSPNGVEGQFPNNQSPAYRYVLHHGERFKGGDLGSESLRIGENFTLASEISLQEQNEYLGIVDYSSLLAERKSLMADAPNVLVVMNSLDAGLGSSIKRKSYLEFLNGAVSREYLHGAEGSKSTDLYFKVVDNYGKEDFLSIAEIKIRRLIQEAQNYGGLKVKVWVSEDSFPAMEAFWESHNHDLLLNRIEYEFIIEQKIPMWDSSSGTPSEDPEFYAPGGHGYAGVMLFESLRESVSQHSELNANQVQVIYNGDGPSNFVSPEMVDFTAFQAGIVILTTTRTNADRKGGIIGLKKTEKGILVPDIMERAQAESAGQFEQFSNAGLQPDHSRQPFNTNTVLINENLTGAFLKKLYDFSPELYEEVVSPEIMFNQHDDTQIYKVEGALGSLILRINEHILTNEFVSGIWQEVAGGMPFLRFVNLDKDQREEFFTPIKNAIDFYLLGYANIHELKENKLVRKTDHEIQLEGDLIGKNGYYSDVLNLINSFGENADMTELEYLEVRGVFEVPNCIFKGKVSLISKYQHPVNTKLLSHYLPLSQTGTLILENVCIQVDETGAVSIS